MTDVALPGMILLLTHLGIGALGFLTGNMVTRRSVVAAREEHTMEKKTRRAIPPGLALILSLVLVIVGLGVQQWLWQNSQDDWKKCVNEWAIERDTVADLRASSNAELQDASLARSAALDDLLVYALAQPDSEHRTEAQKKEIRAHIDRLGKDYTKKVKTVRKKAQKNTATRVDNPFPVLDC